MSVVISRLVLSMLMLPAFAFVYMVLYVVLDQPMRLTDEWALLIADIACVLLMIVAWTLIWFRAIRWTPARVGVSAGVTLGLGVVLAALAWFLGEAAGEEFGIFSWGAGMGALWPVAMVPVWRESGRERRARLATRVGGSTQSAVTCLVCNYDMSGLKEARCPECGAEFTLERLLAGDHAEERESLSPNA